MKSRTPSQLPWGLGAGGQLHVGFSVLSDDGGFIWKGEGQLCAVSCPGSRPPVLAADRLDRQAPGAADVLPAFFC